MYRYILIDDEKLTRDGIKEKLSPLSEKIVCVGEAEDGVDALVMLEQLHPDIVITDMKMPILGGEKLLPILSEKYPDIAVIAVSGYRDTEYFKQAIRSGVIDYILKPIKPQELCAVMEQAISRLEHRETSRKKQKLTEEHLETTQYAYDLEILRNMIAGYSYSEYVPGTVQLRQLFQNRAVMLLTLYSKTDLPQEELSRFLDDHSLGPVLFLPHMYAKNLGFFLLAPPGGEQEAKMFCRQLMERMMRLCFGGTQKILWGASGFHDSVHQLHTAFEESVEALNQLCPKKPETIFFYSPDFPAPRQSTWEQTEELLFCMEAGRAEEVERLVNELFAYFHSQKELSLAELKHTCVGIAGKAYYMLSSYMGQPEGYSADKRRQNVLDTLFDFEELKAYYLQLFKNIALQLQGCSIYSDNDGVVNVKTYIDRNYRKNITVEFLASIFHLNRTYLSFIFKRKMKKSCIDYLNEVRIFHAKELLEQTDKKMYQIAKQAGYNNVSYFYRAFRKAEGMTPEQYRKLRQG